MSLCVKLFYFIFILISDFEMLQCATSPKLKWPLSDRSFSYETKNGEDGNHPTLDECFKVDDSDNGLFTDDAESKGLYYDGSNYCEMDVPDGNLKSEEFAFSIFIMPRSLTGYVLHYKADSDSNSRITQIHLRFVNGELKFTVKSSNGVNRGEVSGGSLTVGSWSLVQFGFYNNRNLVIKINSGSSTKVTISSINFRDEGTLTVGNSDAHNEGFNGTLTCLMAFDDATSFQTRSESEEECEDTGNWGKKPGDDFDEPECTEEIS